MCLQFNGVYHFRYPMSDLEQFVPTLDGMEILVTATVGDRFLDEIIEGYSSARIFNSTVKVNFMGGSPQVFKPAMPFNIYVCIVCYYWNVICMFVIFCTYRAFLKSFLKIFVRVWLTYNYFQM